MRASVRWARVASEHDRGGKAESTAILPTAPGGPEAEREPGAETRDERAGGERTAPALLGRYQIRRQIGSGGMGIVYAAWDPELDRLIALKVIKGAAGDEAK